MTRALVIGGAGFLGGHVARALLERGDEVVILDDFSRGIQDRFLEALATHPRARLIQADLRDRSTDALVASDHDEIYQFAAIIGVRHVLERPYDVLTANVEIQARALEIARKQDHLRRFLFTSTSEVYAGSLLHMDMPVPTPETVPLALTDLSQPRTSYMLSKLYGEAMCHHGRVPFTIVRPHNVYGPRMGLVHVLPELMQKSLALPRGGTLGVASVSHRRAFCYVDDAVEMMLRLVRSPDAANQTFNLGNQSQEASIGDVARMVTIAVGREDLMVEPLPETPGSPSRRCPDMTRAMAVSGFRPGVDLTAGISRTYAWYKENVFTSGGRSAT